MNIWTAPQPSEKHFRSSGPHQASSMKISSAKQRDPELYLLTFLALFSPWTFSSLQLCIFLHWIFMYLFLRSILTPFESVLVWELHHPLHHLSSLIFPLLQFNIFSWQAVSCKFFPVIVFSYVFTRKRRFFEQIFIFCISSHETSKLIHLFNQNEG